MAQKLLSTLRKELVRVADPGRAPAMQAYMKSEMPYHGVPAALLKSTCKTILAQVALPSENVWRDLILELWHGAKFREERYAAIQLAGDRRAKSFQTPRVMPMYEEMIVTGAWWDYVDTIAAHQVGAILAVYPDEMKPMMLSWSVSDNLWKRRTSILCQLQFKQKTDLKLLYACIEPSLPSTEFFLRKAIGWALRQYAWTDPTEVKKYVKRHESQLSGLSKREAMKNLGD